MKRNNEKSFQANIESKRSMFFFAGLAFTLLSVFIAFEWQFKPSDLPDFSNDRLPGEEIFRDIPVTAMAKPELPKSKPVEKFSQTVIAIVPNASELPSLGTSFLNGYIDEGLETIEDPWNPDEGTVFNFNQVENMPIFRGCEEAIGEEARMDCFNQQLLQYVAKNFKVSERMMAFSSSEKVYVEFIIESDGNVRKAQVVRGEDDLVGTEAIRVVKNMPTFTPAKVNGKPVRMSYILPVNVKLN
jgi:protein TonB